MDQFSRPQRPVQQPVATEHPQQEVHMQQPMNTMPATAKRRMTGGTNVMMMAMLFAVAGLLALMLASIVFGKRGGTSITGAIKANKYQSVFISSNDGQVYFGKLSSYNEGYYRLTDIYYPKVEQKLQPGQTQDQAQQVISLAKLGNELHGPEDEMFIPKEKVLFWENLKDDGQVVKAITEYKKSGDKSSANTQTPSVAPETTSTPTTKP